MGCLLLKEALDLNSKLNFNIMNLQYTALMVMGFLGFRCPFFWHISFVGISGEHSSFQNLVSVSVLFYLDLDSVNVRVVITGIKY